MTLGMAIYSIQQRRRLTPPSHQQQQCLRSCRPRGQPSRPTSFLQRTALKQASRPSLTACLPGDLLRENNCQALTGTESGSA
jgi:hypothetical protein